MNTKDLERKKKELESKYKLQTIKDVFKEYIEYTQSPTSFCTTGIKSIDEDQKFKLKSKVGAYIGKGGSKKSMLALNGCNSSCESYSSASLYSTMEMPSIQLFERLMDISSLINFDSYMRTSDFIEHHIKENNIDFIKKMHSLIDQVYGDKFVITQKSRMEAQDYLDLGNKYNEEHPDEPLSYLVVDGLSMMGGKGTQTEVFTTNAGELKDVAKELGVYIPLICHVNKQAKKYTRDLQEFVRGTEQILDFCDFVVMISQVSYNYEEDVIQYINNKNWIEYYAKRGKGTQISLISDFDPGTLRMTESEEPVENYVYTKNDKNFF